MLWEGVHGSAGSFGRAATLGRAVGSGGARQAPAQADRSQPVNHPPTTTAGRQDRAGQDRARCCQTGKDHRGRALETCHMTSVWPGCRPTQTRSGVAWGSNTSSAETWNSSEQTAPTAATAASSSASRAGSRGRLLPRAGQATAAPASHEAALSTWNTSVRTPPPRPQAQPGLDTTAPDARCCT